MARIESNYRNCFLCRIMRGMAFGGLGAALFALPAKWLGADQNNLVYAAMFGALLVTVIFNRKPAGKGNDSGNKRP